VRNAALDKQAQAINANALTQYNDFPVAQANVATQLGDYFGSNTPNKPDVTTSGLMPASNDITVQNDNKGQMDKATAFGDQQAQALGDLRSFGNLLGTADRAQAMDATAVGQIGNDKRGYATNVLPYQLDASGHTGDNMKTFGDVLALAGTAAGAYGALKNPSALAKMFSPNTASNVANFF
jgi:hypothetical protein